MSKSMRMSMSTSRSGIESRSSSRIMSSRRSVIVREQAQEE